MWKLYILTLIGQRMCDLGIRGSGAEGVFVALEDAGLLERDFNLNTVLRSVLDYARRLVQAESIEGGFSIDPLSGFPNGVTGKITFREPNADLRARGFLSADSLITTANLALTASGYQLWVLLDRLDVAFAETHELERNALRALFRVYRDTSEHEAIKLKFFFCALTFREGLQNQVFAKQVT